MAMAGPVPVATVLGGNPGVAKSCAVLVRVGPPPIREYEGEIFTDYYFGEANTANKSDNYHNNAINENLNWGRISGLLHGNSPILYSEVPGNGARKLADGSRAHLVGYPKCRVRYSVAASFPLAKIPRFVSRRTP